jgi:hypothetical protein
VASTITTLSPYFAVDSVAVLNNTSSQASNASTMVRSAVPTSEQVLTTVTAVATGRVAADKVHLIARPD